MPLYVEYVLRWLLPVLIALWFICDVIFPLCVGLPPFRLFRRNKVELTENEVLKQLEEKKRQRQLRELSRGH